MGEVKKHETSTMGILPPIPPPTELKLDYRLMCNDCGSDLTIHYWADGDVYVELCECKPED